MTKLLSMLGLCERAGKLASGKDQVEIALKKGNAHLIVIDEGASEGTKKAAADASRHRNVPMAKVSEHTLGLAIGKPGRMLAAVTDAPFAARIYQIYSETAER